MNPPAAEYEWHVSYRPKHRGEHIGWPTDLGGAVFEQSDLSPCAGRHVLNCEHAR